MAKAINRRVNIYINGKEVKNTLNSVRREMGKLTGQLNNMTAGTEQYEKKSKSLA